MGLCDQRDEVVLRSIQTNDKHSSRGTVVKPFNFNLTCLQQGPFVVERRTTCTMNRGTQLLIKTCCTVFDLFLIVLIENNFYDLYTLVCKLVKKINEDRMTRLLMPHDK